MGMFKDMRDLSKAGKKAKKERGGSLKMMKDGLAQANQAVQQVQTDQALAEKLADEEVERDRDDRPDAGDGQAGEHAARASAQADGRASAAASRASPIPRSSRPP